MRDASTYRAAKRQRVKVWAKDCGTKFIAMWRQEEIPMPTASYRPKRVTGKTYASNGKQECARRLRHVGLMTVTSDGFWRPAS